MNKQELAAALYEEAATTKKEANAMLDALGVVVAKVLASGDEITLPGIGKLSVKKRAARIGRNPATGEELKIKAKKVPHFSAAKALKDAVA